MIKKINRLAHPVFLISLFILLLNDLILKSIFHNYLTGKLSDFAGLLAFPFFWSVLFPKRIKEIHIGVVLFFCFWKSPFSEAFVNFFGFYRIVDFSDYIALMSVFISFQLLRKESSVYKVQPLFLKFIFLLSCFSFIATTQEKYGEETFEDGFSYLYLNNETDKRITILVNFKFSENEIAFFKKEQIKMRLVDYKRLVSEEAKERGLVYKLSDSLRIVKEINDEWLVRKKYNTIDSIVLDKGAERYLKIPLHGNDTLIGFPKDFKISIFNDNRRELKSYDKKAFFNRTENKKLNEFSRRDMFMLTFEKKKEPLNISDYYGKWESRKKDDFNKIETNADYFINDSNGDVYNCKYKNDTIFVYSPNKVYLGIIKKVTKDSLVISWDSKPDLIYVKSKKPAVLAR